MTGLVVGLVGLPKLGNGYTAVILNFGYVNLDSNSSSAESSK